MREFSRVRVGSFSQLQVEGKHMIRQHCTLFSMVFLLALLSVTSVSALGPVDGHELAATDLERVHAGATAPDFSLEDETGKVVSLSQFRGKKNVVLVFYRGHW